MRIARTKKTLLSLLAVAAVLALGGCGDDEDDSSGGPPVAAQEHSAMKEKATQKAAAEEAAAKESGTTVTTTESEFGEILVDSSDQAIYIFENDSEGKTKCFGDCAADWPPVFTSGRPQASGGVEGSLLGTLKRPDGGLQVTYDGKPLYYYSHEGPGEVRCHNVDLNGGFWWVIGPDGERRP